MTPASLKLRFPEAMRARLAKEAKQNQRSLNGEIVYRLACSFGQEGIALTDLYTTFEKEIRIALVEVVKEVIRERH